MRADQADGLPAIGETGRYLGVRPGVDILLLYGVLRSWSGWSDRARCSRRGMLTSSGIMR